MHPSGTTTIILLVFDYLECEDIELLLHKTCSLSFSAARYLAQMSVEAVSKQSHVSLTFCLSYDFLHDLMSSCSKQCVGVENVEVVAGEDTQEIATTCHSMYPYA